MLTIEGIQLYAAVDQNIENKNTIHKTSWHCVSVRSSTIGNTIIIYFEK